MMSHALKRRAVTCTKAKLARIKYVIVLNVPLDYFRITFSNTLPDVDRRLVSRMRVLWVLI
jgi:hypothetical protein